ncbi:probable LRR receptor-like serine/threonine-protein kinase At2g16250 isoform X2 [Andrographis paniculata]|uniref:probable LRR receptor-like serine/threonine-protein kinase At2g16250 isoform X2 n=1 Tax=Andrographis paniculata TaxID=175694 RepID=UPI0021E778EB|nr:probable LRR receptor-like serine/threonine-protein kinase At2g16250 isoform X2 [Andrographis paniculata]
MSAIYDNWERIVGAALLREHLRELARSASLDSIRFNSRQISESSLRYSNLGFQFTRRQILRATGNFSNQNLIKRGRSGDFFLGVFPQPSRGLSNILPPMFPQFSDPIVVKRVDLKVIADREAYLWELKFLSCIGESKQFPLLGHCLKDKDHKYLVYKYMPEGDLASSLFKKHPDKDELISLDWIKRLKIAVGAAEGLVYLHHECNPPLVHGDVQASSILLDNNFEVRLGSLSPTQETEKLDDEDDWFIRDPENDTWDPYAFLGETSRYGGRNMCPRRILLWEGTA